MKTQADKKSVKDIQELKQRFTKFSIVKWSCISERQSTINSNLTE